MAFASALNALPTRRPTRRAALTEPRRRTRPPHNVSMEWKPAGLLRGAVELKKTEVAIIEHTLQERPDHPISLRRNFFANSTDHRLTKSLRRRDGTLSIMGSIKRFQPPSSSDQSAQLLRKLDDVGRETRAFEVYGVDAALVYTDPLNYGMELSDLAEIARRVSTSNLDRGLPLARNDLIIDPVQIAEAAVSGACAVNLIAAAVLDDLLELLNAATAMGVEAMVECHTMLELEFAMECGATIVFLNNWDRSRNRLVPGTAEKLVEAVPPWVLSMAGGGLSTASDCWSMMDAGFNGVVLGRSLLQTPRPAQFIREIRSQKRIVGDIFSGDFGIPFSQGADLES